MPKAKPCSTLPIMLLIWSSVSPWRGGYSWYSTGEATGTRMSGSSNAGLASRKAREWPGGQMKRAGTAHRHGGAR